MNHSSHLLDVPDYPPSSGVSEVDSLSDSDWLDLSSNRESDDNDSVMSGDSDGEDAGLMHLSRRSSISIGSSRDGDVDAWEGFVEESGDEGAQSFVPAHPMPLMAAVRADETALIASQATHDPSEEQRVKEALDQSMISTLSASRSSTASAHASLRDLRLSFPDPLTSSQNELNRSYDKVTPSDVAVDTKAKAPTDSTTVVDDVPTDVDSRHCKEDPGLSVTTPAVSEQAFEENKGSFDLVLYGLSSSIKWSFVCALMEKANLASGHTLLTFHHPLEGTFKFCVQTKANNLFLPSVLHDIPVYDRTGPFVMNALPSLQMVKRPSLAIVYLPAILRTPIPTNHTIYLPVLEPSASPDERILASREWNELSIPSDKVVRLSLDLESPIFDGSDVEGIQDEPARRLLQRLLFPAKKRPVKGLSDHLSPAHAVTLFALMSLIVGFAMNTAFRKSTPPTPTTTTSSPASTFWGISSPEINHTSVVLTSSTRSNTQAPILSAHKEHSLSIFNPDSTSLAITSNKLSKTSPLTTPVVSVVSASHCIPSIWTKVKSVKDAIVDSGLGSGTRAAPEAGPSTPAVPQSNGPRKSESKTTALSLVIESFTEVVDTRVERLRNEYRVNELIESLDDLARAIRRQTLHGVYTGKGKAREIRDSVQYRHERARGKAKELKKRGEEIISLAGAEFSERTIMAKKRAREITTNLANLESWRTYQQVQANWISLLEEKGREGSTDGRAPKKRQEGTCRSRKNAKACGGPCRLFSRSLGDF